MFVAVIMAGGKGQRFWPLSTAARPKQFLDLDHCGRTLIQTTFDRVLPLAESPERVFVATAQRYVPLVREQLPEIPEANVLVEPEARDSAPAVALATLIIERRLPGSVTGFFSSDHRIGRPDAFHGAQFAAPSAWLEMNTAWSPSASSRPDPLPATATSNRESRSGSATG